MPKYSMLVAFVFLVASPATAQKGNAHLETMSKQCQIWKTLAPSTISPALAEKMAGEMAGLYAPKIDCTFVATSDFGFSLESVPLPACLAAPIKTFAGAKIIEFDCDDVALDESGSSVLLYQKVKIQLPTGQTITPPVFSKYDFGGDGKIVAYNTQFDTSVLDGLTPASKNTATVAKQCQILRQIQGATIDAALAKKLLPELVGLYAGAVDCNWVSTSADFGFSLAGVPYEACVGQTVEKMKGMQVIITDCADIAADTSGKTVMAYSHTKIKLLTGESVALPLFNKYEFDDAGKIAAYNTQFDTSVLMTSAVRLSSTASWSPSPTLTIPAACLVGAAAAAVLARVMSRQSPRLLEGYEDCA